MIRIGVTGTDTGVGKTTVSAALAASFRRRGRVVAAMKPVETGVTVEDPSRDGMRLARAAGCAEALAILAPMTLAEPLAPLIAARRAGTAVDIAALDAAMRKATAHADVLLVEGAGGLLVPITEELSFDGLFARWSLDVVIVAANRLGVINHTRLTVAATRAAGLTVRAVVLNDVGDARHPSMDDNAVLIAELTRLPVAELPRLPLPDDLAGAADAIERSGLIELIGG